MNLGKVFQVARREYLARVRSRAFIFSTLLVPGMFALWGVVPGLLQRTDIDELRLTVVDSGTGLGAALAGRLAETEDLPVIIDDALMVSATDEPTARQRLSDAVRSGELDGYLVLRPDPEVLARGRYYARETGNPIILDEIEGAVEATVLENWFTGDELDRIRRVRGADLETITVSAEGEEAGGFLIAYISTFGLGMLLYMTVLMHGQQMAMAIVEEKSSRLIELIIGAVTAVEYMSGKVLGVLGAGLTQLVIWVLMGAAAFLYVLPAVAFAGGMLELDLAQIFAPGLLAYFFIFLLLGYLLYSTMFAAIGSTCNSTEELGHAMFPAFLPMIVALFSTFYVMTNPNSVASVVLSFIPLFTPLVMFARVNVAEPPAWEVWLGILVLIAAVAFCIWAAAKIFRVAILMHGKRPAIGDLWRMVRAA